MNKGIIFGFGTLFGAGVGSVTTYFLTKEYFKQQAAEEIEAYAEHAEERIERIRLEHEDEKTMKEMVEDVEEKLTNDPEEDVINHNEGVKKYHHNNGISSKYGENNVFSTSTPQPKKEKEVKKQIEDIDEDEFMNEANGDYAKETIDVLLGDDQDVVGFWGYQTDNEDFVERIFKMDLKDLVGLDKEDYDYMLNETDNDEGIGTLYIRNNSIMKDFEVIIHDEREEDKL